MIAVFSGLRQITVELCSALGSILHTDIVTRTLQYSCSPAFTRQLDKVMEDGGAKHQYALLVDPQTGQEFNLCRFATAVGRASSCDIVLADKSVSRQHAIIYCLKGKFYIEDVGSTNGTMLNKKPVLTRVALMSGDEVRIGITPLLFLQIPDRNGLHEHYVDKTPTVPHSEEEAEVVVAAFRDRHERAGVPASSKMI